MKVYFYDMITGEYQSTAEIASDATLDSMMQTAVAPPTESPDYVYDRTAGAWSLKVADPTQQDRINANLTKQLAVVTKTAETAQSAVVALTKQLAAQAKEA